MKTIPALIVSTYNWPEALELCFRSIASQTILPGEVIVADDGSGSSTREVIQKYKHLLPVPVRHVWHEDKGFRLAEIRNRAILQAESDYLIFIDGDVILDKNFIADHVYFRKFNHFITGSRVLINAGLTKRYLAGMPFRYHLKRKGFRNRLNGLRNRMLARIFLRTDDNCMNVRGCNLAFWKRDLLETDGFNQEFTGWGREDSELAARLINAGRKRLKLKFAAVQFHLHHNQRNQDQLSRNNALLEKTLKLKITRAGVGISSLKNNL